MLKLLGIGSIGFTTVESELAIVCKARILLMFISSELISSSHLPLGASRVPETPQNAVIETKS